MNSFVAFIVKDLLGQASILIAFIAMLGLILQKKSPGKTAEGTFKTLLGFLIMMAGINIIVATLTFLNDIFTQGFGMKGYITDVAAIAGLANRELGSEVALTLLVIFAVNIIIARLTPLKYIFLTGQALLWMATIGAVIGYKSGLTGVPLILTGGIFGGVMAVLMRPWRSRWSGALPGLTMWPWGTSVLSAIWCRLRSLKLSEKALAPRKISNCLITLSFCRIPIWPWRW